jgi:RNA polymerase sigma factor (sigma-70 family)
MLFDTPKQREEFIVQNMNLVRARVHRMLRVSNQWHLFDDVCQEGFVALTLATDRFDEEKGTKFSSYAVVCIDGYLMSYFNRKLAKQEVSLEENLPCFACSDNIEADIICDFDNEAFFKSLPKQKKFIVFYSFLGYSRKEIGLLLSTGESNVGRIIRDIRKEYEKFKTKNT